MQIKISVTGSKREYASDLAMRLEFEFEVPIVESGLLDERCDEMECEVSVGRFGLKKERSLYEPRDGADPRSRSSAVPSSQK